MLLSINVPNINRNIEYNNKKLMMVNALAVFVNVHFIAAQYYFCHNVFCTFVNLKKKLSHTTRKRRDEELN